MTRPTARVLALLEILQAGGTRTVGDLAARLGVDERTVRRYASHLVDLEIPVQSVRGRYGGYRLAPGYRLPPLMFTDEEALAVLLGLAAGRRMTTSVAAAESAAAKIQRVLPVTLRRRLDALLGATADTAPARPVVPPETTVLLRFAEAVRDRRPVAVGYTASNGRHTDRTVQPYGIVAHHGRWYVTGADSASGESRSFRLDRVTTAVTLEGSFDVPEGFDPAAHLLAGIANAPHRHEVSVRVRGTAAVVRSRFPTGLVTVEELDADGWVRVRLRAERLDWVPGVLVATGMPFVVEGPQPLRRLVLALAEELVVAAGDDGNAGEGDGGRPAIP